MEFTVGMVFESLVTDLLNKYLGQYVENLDPSQLKIGIWGGVSDYKYRERLHYFYRLFTEHGAHPSSGIVLEN